MAARPKLMAHNFTHKSQTFNCIVPDVYGGSGALASNIESATGLERGGDDNAIMTVTASDAVKQGILARIRISHVDANDNRKSSTIYVATSKADSAIGAVIGKQYLGRTIKTAGFPRRRNLG
jgi:hypothetical protein